MIFLIRIGISIFGLLALGQLQAGAISIQSGSNFLQKNYDPPQHKVSHRVESEPIFPFRLYTIKDGLVGNRIRSLMQDSRGFIWIGTSEGLSVYDGTKFSNITYYDSKLIGSIITISESKKEPGTVWCGSGDNGLFKISNDTIIHYFVDSTKEKANTVFSLYEDNDGILWCGTSAGLYNFRNGHFYKIRGGYNWGNVKRIFRHQDNSLFIVSDNTCTVYDEVRHSTNLIELKIAAGGYTTDAIIDGDGDVWIGTSVGELIRIKDQTISRRYQSKNKLVKPELDDGKGNIWGGDRESVWKIAKSSGSGHIDYVTEKNGLPFKSSWTMLTDTEGNLWFGNYTDGLAKLEDLRTSYFKLGESEFSTSSDRNVWIVTGNNVIEYSIDNDNKWLAYNHPVGSASELPPIKCLVSDNNKYLYASAYGRGIYQYVIEGERDRRLVLKKKYLLDGLTWGLFVDFRKRVWFARQSLPLGYVGPHSRIYASNDFSSSKIDGIYRIYQTRDSLYWFADYEGGLFTCNVDDNGDISNFAIVKEMKNIAVRSIFQSRDGRIIFGTAGNGIFIKHSSTYRNITLIDGLPSNTVYDIAEDDDRNIWLATAHGVCYLDSKNSYKVTVVDELFGKYFGKCGIIDSTILWALGKTDLTIYNFARDGNSAIPPPIYITKMSVNGNNRPFSETLELSSSENNIEISYIGVSFKGEKGVRYKYSIDGNHSGWHATDQNRLSLVALKPGDYRFSVYAINKQGIQSSSPATITFLISHPYWQRWWFFLLILSGLVLAGGIYFRIRINKLRAIEKVRNRISKDLHDDIGSNLTGIAVSSKIIQRQSKPADAMHAGLIDIEKTAEKTLDLMRDIVWFINPSNDSVEDLILRMKEIAPLLLGSIEYTFDKQTVHSNSKIDIEVKRNLFLIFKEALTNIAKHSRATAVSIKVNQTKHKIEFCITDNGVGFNAGNHYAGNGLANFKKRAKEINGVLDIKSASKSGTMISVSAPLT